MVDRTLPPPPHVNVEDSDQWQTSPLVAELIIIESSRTEMLRKEHCPTAIKCVVKMKGAQCSPALDRVLLSFSHVIILNYPQRPAYFTRQFPYPHLRVHVPELLLRFLHSSATICSSGNVQCGGRLLQYFFKMLEGYFPQGPCENNAY